MSLPFYDSLDDWIAQDSVQFSLDAPSLNGAIDRVMQRTDDAVELLGLGEPLHGGEEFLVLRNRMFQRLVEAHGYRAIAVESSFPKSRLASDFVAGRGTATWDEIQDGAFSHGFGRLAANRELLEWMRSYNSDPSNSAKIQFYGFDGPMEMSHTDSPRELLRLALDYLSLVDAESEQQRRERIETLLGSDADWENPDAMMDPAKSVGVSPAATALRIETEDLIIELQVRRPEFSAKGGRDRYLEAAHYAASARSLLNYHAALARPSNQEKRLMEGLGIRDAMMADNLEYIVPRERGRGGKVFAFAHNSHLKRGKAQWQLGPHALVWWPAGAQIAERLGPRYAVIGGALGISEDNGIGQPELETLEARLIADGHARFIATHHGQALPACKIAALPVRTGSTKNFSYFPLTRPSFTDYTWLAVLCSATYTRGGPPIV